jgi:hypothetical protein
MGLVYELQYPCWVGGLYHLSCLWWGPGVAYLRVLMPWCVTSSWKTSGRDWQRFMLKMWRVSFCITSGWNSVPSVPLNVKNISNDDILYRIRSSREITWKTPVKVHQHICRFMALVLRIFKGCFRLVLLNSCCTVARRKHQRSV